MEKHLKHNSVNVRRLATVNYARICRVFNNIIYKAMFLWYVTPCGFLTIYESFGETYRMEVKGIIKDENKRLPRNVSNHLRH